MEETSSDARWLGVPAGILEGDRAVVAAGDRQIVVLRVNGQLHAFDNACPHQGNPLVEGEVLGDVLECAYHGWRFDLATGACLVGAEAARRYPVELVGDELRIDLNPEI
jgi:nitrite reductase (NADH) small subunit